MKNLITRKLTTTILVAAVSLGTIQSQAHAGISGIRENCY